MAGCSLTTRLRRSSRPSTGWVRSCRRGRFVFLDDDEDVHTAIERRVTELVGETGAKLHTARSRNDQVATGMRLWCRRGMVEVAARVLDFQQTILRRAAEAGTPTSPGTRTYSGLSRCSWPTISWPTVGSRHAIVDRVTVRASSGSMSPRSAPGALAGSSLPSTRTSWPRELGFSTSFAELLDAVSRSRLRRRSCLAALALVAVHLSRLREDARAVVHRGVRLLHDRRRVHHRKLAASRKRRTPMWPS